MKEMSYIAICYLVTSISHIKNKSFFGFAFKPIKMNDGHATTH